MSWRDGFNRRFGPGGMSGCTFSDWLKILWRTRFAVDMKYWPRAAFATSNSFFNSMWTFWEDVRYSKRIEQTDVPAPLFVLGIWRSGTTHLHNLFAQDSRFAYPTTYQVFYPRTFLSMERWHAPAMQSFLSATRPMDNVKQGMGEPQEDEFALTVCGLSFQIGMLAFPRSGQHFRRYLTLRELSPSEMDDWKTAWLLFLRKLTFRFQQPLVLKSPGHTARIRAILEMFPGARFVHIHRNPYEVFQSTEHTWSKVHEYWAFQKDMHNADRIIRDYVDVYDAFFADRHLIPESQYCEVAYEQLTADPFGEMRRIYETLNLPAFDAFETKLREYLKSIAGYSRNTFPELSQEMRDRLAGEWSRCFEEWGYEK